MSDPEPEFELSSEPDDPEPDESDPGPEFDDPDPEESDPEPDPDDPLLEEPEPELGEFDSGVDPVEGVVPKDGVLSPPSEAVVSLGDTTSRGARGAPAGTRSVGVERSLPATTYALNVSVMATAMPPSAQASPFITFRTESMVGASVPADTLPLVKPR